MQKRNLIRSAWISVATFPIFFTLLANTISGFPVHLQLLQIIGVSLLFIINRYVPDLYLMIPALVVNVAFIVWVKLTGVYLTTLNFLFVFTTSVWAVVALYFGDRKVQLFNVAKRDLKK